MWPFNTGDCLIKVTAWAGLPVIVLKCGNNSDLTINSQRESLWIHTNWIIY
jgi:hypothetical protein